MMRVRGLHRWRAALGLWSAALAVFLLMGAADAAPAQASWLLDAGKLHFSVHKDISCADCHEDVSNAARHPNPAYVTRPAPVFSAERCYTCHESVREGIGQGTHGGAPLQKGADYARCITCHDPHAQPAAGAASATYDPKKPAKEQCGACHEARKEPPAPSAADAACLRCHAEASGPAAAVMCLHCHGAEQKTPGIRQRTGVLDAAALKSATHQSLTCAQCHGKSAQFPHNRQERASCLQCHTRHGESQAHDAHLSVACESCHLAGVTPVKRGETVGFALNKAARKDILRVHDMRAGNDDAACGRCHYPGNSLGAAGSVLPPKGVLCMGCHASTFSVGGAVGAPFLAMFLLAMGPLCVFWWTGRGAVSHALRHTSGHSAPLGARLRRLPGVILWDVILLRRLYRESRERWAIHALIFYPFLLRFLWGMAGLLTSLWIPGSNLPWALLNKNGILHGVFFDLTGLALLAGIVLAARYWRRHPLVLPGLPRRDWPALAFIGGIALTGFVLEGLRIALTGLPTGSSYAFLGYPLALLFRACFSPAALTEVYVWGWYAHAIVTGCTVAYIPFSQLRHCITAPLALLAEALRGR